MKFSTVKNNYYSFLWHAAWLALAKTFAEINTVMPAFILSSGGGKIHVGILTSIMIGIPILTQIIFAGYLSNKEKKKNYLLVGINLRAFALFGVAVTLKYSADLNNFHLVLPLIFLLITIFALSGSFAGISYTDILGKSIEGELRKKFFVSRQFVSAVGVLISALLVRKILNNFNYPTNYFYMFLLASLFLFLASLGFWNLKERAVTIKYKTNSLKKVLKDVPRILRTDSNLRSLAIAVNLIGVSLTLSPFYIVLVKSMFGINNEFVGKILLSQIIGMILSNYFWSKLVKVHSFKGALKFSAFIHFLVPLAALILFHFKNLTGFYYLFFLIGTGFSGLRISTSGAFIEITNETNRALYTGIYGSVNIVIAVLPLIYGAILNTSNFIFVSVAAALFTLFSLPFVKILNCPTNIE